MEYKYNLSGAMVEEKYPSGRIVKTVLDDEGDLQTVKSQKNSNNAFWNYANHFTYTAAGAVSSMQLGNGTWEKTAFNSRLQPTQIALGKVQNTTDLLQLDYTYGVVEAGTLNTAKNNGNIQSQTITVPTVGSSNGFTAVQTYNYDSLNRIKDATEIVTPTGSGASQSWGQTYTFDRYGNRNFDEANTTTIPKNCGTSPNLTVCPADRKVFNPSIANTNRINLDQEGDSVNDYAFDSSGNTTKDASGRTFVYDAENKQIEVKNASNETIGQYWFDGDGRRVKKRGWINGQWETTVFVYDASSRLVAEYSTILNETPQVAYLTNDHLGSPRINTNENGAVISRHDYRPYGEEITERMHTQYAADTIRKQFTGYERDGETDLDFAQARVYFSAIGRFMSRDPINIERQRLTDPQSINLYCYSRNVPTKYSDPDGKRYVDEKGKRVKITYQYDEQGNVVGIASIASNAPADLQKLAKLISEKGSPTALKWFVRGDLSKTKINVAIQGVTGRTRPHDKNGPIDGRLGGNTLRTPDYVRENGKRAYRAVSIGVASQELPDADPNSFSLLRDTREDLNDPDISPEDYLVAEFAHELSHALSTDEIASVRELDKEKEKMTPEQRQDRKAMSDLREKYYDRFEERNAALLVTVLKEIGGNRR